MKKIFIFNGSRNGKKSLSTIFIEQSMDKLKEISKGINEIEYEIYSPLNTGIKQCKGCLNCFQEGRCPLDSSDSMKDIKEKLLGSDFIIFASPVFLHNVNGDMKTFIDRITYWTHLLRLNGKPSIAIATSTGNGLDIVSSYLSKVLTYCGSNTLSKIELSRTMTSDEGKKKVLDCAETIFSALNKDGYESNDLLEKIFQLTKKNMIQRGDLNDAEYEYWKSTGLIESDSFKSYISI